MSEQELALLKALETRLEKASYKNVKMKEVFDDLTSKSTGVLKFVVDEDSLKEQNILDPLPTLMDDPVTFERREVKIRAVLKSLFHLRGLDYYIKNGELYVAHFTKAGKMNEDFAARTGCNLQSPPKPAKMSDKEIALRKLLDSTITASYDKVPMKTVFANLESETKGVLQIVVEEHKLREGGIEPDLLLNDPVAFERREVKLGAFLKTILNQRNMDYYIEEDDVHVTRQAAMPGQQPAQGFLGGPVPPPPDDRKFLDP